jgi:uncharacterized membrane protein HdeD (DUF308 family)
MLLTLLLILAGTCFLVHVILLFTSFGDAAVKWRRYFWSHITLWITGLLGTIITWTYAGKDVSPVIDVFDTPFKQSLPLITALGLSLLAHSIVRLLVLPRYQR